jgi:hypothetical protein
MDDEVSCMVYSGRDHNAPSSAFLSDAAPVTLTKRKKCRDFCFMSFAGRICYNRGSGWESSDLHFSSARKE